MQERWRRREEEETIPLASNLESQQNRLGSDQQQLRVAV
jgi:hypothetical protein